MVRADTEEQCSFCGKRRSDVAYLIAGPANVRICDECVQLSTDVLADELPMRNDRVPQVGRPWWRFWDR